VVNAAQIHRLDGRTEVDEPAHRLNVTGQENSRALIALPLLELPAGIVRRGKVHVHLGRDAHAIQLLLPFTSRYLVVYEGNESEIERLSPPHDDLSMNQAVVDAIEINGHASPPVRW
jgi:hypothetical protein